MVDFAIVKGMPELQKTLDKFSVAAEKKIVRKALREGAKVQLRHAQEIIPVRSGELKRTLKIRTSFKRGKLSTFVSVGDKDAWYAHLVEFGTAKHFIKPKEAKSLFIAGVLRNGVDHPGAAPKPFMRRTLNVSKGEATRAFKLEVQRGTEREIKKLNKVKKK